MALTIGHSTTKICKHQMETKYGEYTEEGKYRNVIICKKCKEKIYSYVKEHDKQ